MLGRPSRGRSSSRFAYLVIPAGNHGNSLLREIDPDLVRHFGIRHATI